MRGRKPIPTQLKIAAGNPGKRPLPPSEPAPPPGVPQCPAHLTPAAQMEWARWAPLLVKQRILTVLDCAVLAIHCQALARAAKAEAELAKKGEVLTGKDGGTYQNPWLAVLNKCNEVTLKTAAELGLTPSSRTRVHAAKEPDGEAQQGKRRFFAG